MSIAERSSSTKRFSRVPAPTENVLLAVVALAFLILHVLAGTLVNRALPDDAPAVQPENAIASNCD
jgi:hypothetical protein